MSKAAIIELCRRAGLALALGWILQFYSETMFWSYWRQDQSIAAFFVTWLFYAVAAEICLITVHEFRVRSLAAIFLTGAVFGWFIEGVVVGTFFGTPEIPFPFTIAWTGLAWHAMISITVGWYAMTKALAHSLQKTFILSAVMGLYWGFWALSWKYRNPFISETGFFVNALVMTTGLAAAYYFFPLLDPKRFSAHLTEKMILATLCALYFVFMLLPHVGFLTLSLLACGALVFWTLQRNAQQEKTNFLVPETRIPPKRLAVLFIMPIIASGIFHIAPPAQTNIPLLIVTTLLGTIYFIINVKNILTAQKKA